MARGLDYAFSHPNLPCIVQGGYSFVARYVGDPDPNPLKYLDAAEVKALRVLGIDIVVCRETTAGFMLTDDGGTHARIARHHCNSLGLHGVPIYYALDVDPRGLSSSQINAITRFLQAAANADGGGHMVGLYGAASAIDRWVGTPYCHWGWQTYAWSAGRISPKAHFRQYRNGQAVCGGTVDLNETYAADFGQWPRPNVPPPPPPEPDKPKDDKMYALMKGKDTPWWWFTDFVTKRNVSPDEAGFLAFVIRSGGGTVMTAAGDGVNPQEWEQAYVDSIARNDVKVQLLDFVADPDGKDGVWLIALSSTRWFIDTSTEDGDKFLNDHQAHWAARGYDTSVKTWTPADVNLIPIAGGAAPPPPGEPVAWPAEGKIHGEITFTQ